MLRQSDGALSNCFGPVLLTTQTLNSKGTCEELIQTLRICGSLGFAVVVQFLLMTWFPLWLHCGDRIHPSRGHGCSLHHMTVTVLLTSQVAWWCEPLPPAHSAALVSLALWSMRTLEARDHRVVLLIALI